MAVELATGYVSLAVSAKGIKSEIERELGGPVAAAAKDAGDSASKSLQSTGQNFTKFGVGALAVAGVVGAGLLKTGQSASDLGESINAVKVTFGSAADGILKLGEDAATSVGLSNTAFNSLAVQFSSFATTIAGEGGNVIATMGEMTGRAADFASVMNIEVADAARIFQSGLAGETEPLKKFGIDLSAAAVNAFAAANGIGTMGKELTEAEKVQARYGLLMEQTAKTQGDFANTADSAANATRIAKAEMENAAASVGAALTPAMAFAASTVASLAKGFVGLNDATGGWLAKGAGIGALALGAAGGISLLVGQLIKMNSTFEKAKSGFVNNAGELTKMGKVAKGAVAPLAVLTVVAVGLGLRASHAAGEIEKITKASSELSKVGDADVLNTLFEITAQGVVAGQSLNETYKILAQTNIEGAKRALELAEANGTNTKITDALRHAIAGEERAVRQAATTTKEFAVAIDDEGDAATNLTTGVTILTAATEGIAAAAELAKRKSDEFADSLVRQREKTEDLYGIEFSAIQSKRDLADSTRQAELDIAAMTETLKKNKAGTDEARAATDTARDSVIKAAEDYGTLNGAALDSDTSIRRQIDSLTLQASQMAPGSALRVAIEQYIAELAEIPSNVSTRLQLNISMGQVSTAAGDLIGVRAGVGNDYFAKGGPASGWGIAGEDGPELIDFGNHSFVHTAAQTRALLSSWTGGSDLGTSTPPIQVYNYREDIGVAELNHVLAMSRLAS